ncbi:MAG: flagellin [Pseudomonadota bacterium]
MAMSGIINTNANSLFTQNALNGTSSALNQALQRLSTGLKINSPGDDPAGYAVAQRFTTQINGTNQAISNAQQATALVQSATGGIQKSTDLLQQIRKIAVQAANGSNSDSDRAALQNVVAQLKDQISTIAKQTQFNGKNLLDGTFSGEQFQVGANAFQIINVSVGNASGNKIGVQEVNKFNASSSVFVTGGNYAFTTGNLDISGSAGAARISVANSDSAKEVATAINLQTKNTNVSAVARTSQEFTVASGGAISFTLANGDFGGLSNSVNISANISDTNDLTALVTAINAQTAKTGITATSNANKITLTQADGENIVFSGVAGAAVMTADSVVLFSGAGNSAGIIQGQVSLQSDAGFSTSGNAQIVATTAGTSFASGVFSSALSSVSDIDVSTVDGANKALQIADFALKFLNAEGGRLGAQQERIKATLATLQTASLNLTAGRSAVQDANLAEETSELTKNQILQQAGISTLAQANQLQQAFLKLLP